MRPEERYVYLSFHLDSNRINARGRLPAVTQLERWHGDGVIDLELSEVAHDEVVQAAPRISLG